ncbi:MAG: DUF4870 domain-containing protein [Moorea sp. SIO3G5]|nr:DUF4870 domain-containing protein [Moorena sp. SIO3G5]
MKQGTVPRNDRKARIWGMLCHLSSLLWIPLLIMGLPIPLANLAGPLMIWLNKRNKYPFVKVHGKESINFQISITLYATIILTIFTAFAWAFFILIGAINDFDPDSWLELFKLIEFWLWCIASMLGIIDSLLVTMASIAAQYGRHYRYPFTLRFLR